MQVGIGLPTTTPGAERSLFSEWVGRAEQGPGTSRGKTLGTSNNPNEELEPARMDSCDRVRFAIKEGDYE